MKVVAFARHGGPEVLEVTSAPEPTIGDSDVLVRVRACGVNHGVDGRVRRDGGGRAIGLPHVLGSEIAGEVAAVGPRVTGLAIGARVVVAPWVTCGRCTFCLRGMDNACESVRMIGVDRWGGYAELVAVPHTNVLALPATLDFARAACLPVGYVTAWHMIGTRLRLRPGETLLVLGAAGVVGTAAIQLAKLLGAKVIAAAGSADKRAFALEQGADCAVDYLDGALAQTVMDLTAGRGVDAAIDHVGAATWESTLSCIAREGRVAVCGATTGFDLRINARQLWRRNVSLHFSNSGTRADLREVVQFAAAGRVRPFIAHALPLEQAPRAHGMLDDRSLIGKLVLASPVP